MVGGLVMQYPNNLQVQTIDEGHVLVTTPELDWLEAQEQC